MNIKELLLENDFNTVWSHLGFSDEHKEYYFHIYNSLIKKTPKENTDNMVIKVQLMTEEDDSYYDVTGYENGESFSISMTDWDCIAGFDVDLEDILPEKFIYELLYEISFYGTEDDMVKIRTELEESVERIRNGEEKTFSIEEVLLELECDEDIDYEIEDE